MNITVFYFGLGLSVAAGIAAAILAWKVANFFLARREFYIKSPYEILMKKLGWCLFWFLFTIYVGVSIMVPKKDIDKYLKSNNHTTTKQKDDQ
jgi:hypothetical protein